MVCCVLSCVCRYWLLTCPILSLRFQSSSSHVLPQLGLEKKSSVLCRMDMTPVLHLSPQDGLRGVLTQINGTWGRARFQGFVDIVSRSCPILLVFWCSCQWHITSPFPLHSFFFFFWPHPWYMEIPRPGIQSKLQLQQCLILSLHLRGILNCSRDNSWS